MYPSTQPRGICMIHLSGQLKRSELIGRWCAADLPGRGHHPHPVQRGRLPWTRLHPPRRLHSAAQRVRGVRQDCGQPGRAVLPPVPQLPGSQARHLLAVPASSLRGHFDRLIMVPSPLELVASYTSIGQLLRSMQQRHVPGIG
jgi:hypothetical protein